MSHRQRCIAIANAVRSRIDQPYAFALAWNDEREVIGRYMRAGRADYRLVVLDDDASVVAEFVAWVHADNPRTS